MSQVIFNELKNKINERKTFRVDRTDNNAISTLDKLDSEISVLLEEYIVDALNTIQV